MDVSGQRKGGGVFVRENMERKREAEIESEGKRKREGRR